jgi:hypothetical protein
MGSRERKASSSINPNDGGKSCCCHAKKIMVCSTQDAMGILIQFLTGWGGKYSFRGPWFGAGFGFRFVLLHARDRNNVLRGTLPLCHACLAFCSPRRLRSRSSPLATSRFTTDVRHIWSWDVSLHVATCEVQRPRTQMLPPWHEGERVKDRRHIHATHGYIWRIMLT